MSLWKPLTASSGVVRGRMWSHSAGRGVDTHRRGFLGRVWADRGPARAARIESCGHAHKSRGAADTCARRWANRKNAARCCINCGIREDMHGTNTFSCSNYEAP